MYKSLAGLLGAASVLALSVSAQAAPVITVQPASTSQAFDPSAVQDVQYYHHYYHHRHWHHWHRGPVVVIHPG